MVYTSIDRRNGIIKCSKHKWNQELQVRGFTAKFWTFYGFISMVYRECRPWEIVINLFFTITFISFTKNQKQNHRHCGTSYVTSMVYTLIDHSPSTNQRAKIRSVIIRIANNMVSPCHPIAKRRSTTRNLKILACALRVRVQKPCSADWTTRTDHSIFPETCTC